jgi:hypothetical protein
MNRGGAATGGGAKAGGNRETPHDEGAHHPAGALPRRRILRKGRLLPPGPGEAPMTRQMERAVGVVLIVLTLLVAALGG